ncbi:hypothetical protein RJT34_11225 [Clitoria ternatea]|uniref:Leucine-rich repeat-containing N-terminal plant-type domain-containing protein n=1 Tax=Clitoria ternatea TaxID=43366 RepID=A0AAN9PJB7_CLITE
MARQRFLGAMFVVLLLSNYSSAELQVGCREKERHALLEFKAGLVGGDSELLSSWESNNKSDCCEWEGITCSNQTGHVVMLHLSGDNQHFGRLGGEIRASLMELQHLQYLNLSWNDFTDINIPEFFGSLTNLRFLDLLGSHFVGRIPINLTRLSHLQYLDLSENSLEGIIPHQVGNLSHLQYLDLSFNNLGGTIPYQLGSLLDLQELYLGYNTGLNHGGHGGEWLSNLTLLTHLDLSTIYLEYAHGWLQTVPLLPKIEELSLSNSGLSRNYLLSLSPFNFSTSLASLDLSGNTITSFTIFQWVFNASINLIELDLSFNLLRGPISYDFGNIKNPLELLDLSHNELQGTVLESFRDLCSLHSLQFETAELNEDISAILRNLSGCVRYSLQELNLRNNHISGTLPDLSIFPSLKALDLSCNRLSGNIPEGISLLPELESLALYSNSLEGGIPESFFSLCALRSLYLSNNSLNGELSVIIRALSAGPSRFTLKVLGLGSNQITGTMPDMSIFPSLEIINLSNNLLQGMIPENIQFPSQLSILKMQFNNLQGIITESHFANVSMLHHADLGCNSLALTFSENWVPPFQLDVIYLSSCKLGPKFPKWLHTQKYLSELDISNAEISDLVPMWFWERTMKLQFMNISHNNLTGVIPNLPIRFSKACRVVLDSNQFEGSIPPFLRTAGTLQLSKNKFSEAHLFLCVNTEVDVLGILDVSENQLSGQLPDCWSHFKVLKFLDLSDNTLSGEIPSSLGSLLGLQVLKLRGNSFIGNVPFSLQNCTSLNMLDLGENELSGPIPSWIGIGVPLLMLSLRRNYFTGTLPQNLCYLTGIQLLDLSANNLSGQILKCLKGFSTGGVVMNLYIYNGDSSGGSFVQTFDLIALLMWKGVEQRFKNDLLILSSIDLSSNQLTGHIPEEIGNLVELVSLNLSRNNLSGKITPKIGRLTSLDFLDLSRNHFSGSIPPALSQIDRLSVLDLSYNNLLRSCRVSMPQVMKAMPIFVENHLTNPEDEAAPEEPKTLEESSPEDKNSIYLIMSLGFITGFWGLLGSTPFDHFPQEQFVKASPNG